MDDKELREKIKNFRLSLFDRYISNGSWVEAEDATSQILSLIDIDKLAKERGYVKLDEDQSTPTYTLKYLSDFDAKRAQSNFTDSLFDFGIQVIKDMLKAGFRKVKL